MTNRKFTSIFLLAVTLLCGLTATHAQAPWSGAYGNEWLAGKYNQPWVKINVSKAGVMKVTLPAAFQNKPTLLHLYHRGTEVSLISASNTEIEFYGVPNDGAMDALLYRLPTSRKNQNYSLYSDQSSYFLTVSNTPRAATPTVSLVPDQSLAKTTSHKFTYFRKFVNEYSHTTFYGTRPPTLNSYFEEGKAATGSRIANNGSLIFTNTKSAASPVNYVAEPYSYQVKAQSGNAAPQVNIRLKGRGWLFTGSCLVDVYAGSTANAATQRLTGSTTTQGFQDFDYNFELTNADVDANGNGYLGFKSTGSTVNDAFSVSYYSVSYDQQITMQGLNSYEFNFPAESGNSRFTVSNLPAGTVRFFDVTNPDQIRIINGSAMKLYASNETTTLTPVAVTFTQVSPSAYDYLIVTNETLATAAASYGEYRKNESPGKLYKPLVIKIQDVYNQFNYGEPSPVAIRRFVDYMVSDNNKDKYLLLMGKSVTYFERTTREIPDEIPTVGFPGSDLLLVDGLKGTPEDVPTIPYGRISAISTQQVLDYLDKVKTYESQGDLSWRKNIIHVSGGKGSQQVQEFANYLSTIATQSKIAAGPFFGKVIAKTKTLLGPSDTEQITLAPELNGTAPGISGAGMVTYFGHGNVDVTDLNFGYAMDPSREYDNVDKYPVVFYNGCGVNNIFSNRNNLFSQGTTLRRPLSLDWLLAPKKGAIAVFGNDWDAYASTSNEYLDDLYLEIFTKTDAERGTIGGIIQAVAAKMKEKKGYMYDPVTNGRVASYYDYDRANVHQIILQGDPALRMLVTSGPLPVELVSFDAQPINENAVQLTWKTASEKNNSHFVIERSYNAKNFEEIGRVEGKGTTNVENTYMFMDAKPLGGKSYYRLKQLDEVAATGKPNEVKSSYSKIVSVSRANSEMLIVQPNPTTDWVEIRLDAPVAVKSWEVIDQKGAVRKTNGKGTKVNLSNFARGEYIIKIVTENEDTYFKKILKQ